MVNKPVTSSKKRSEKRQKEKMVFARVSEKEHAQIKAKAEKLGLTISAFMRIQTLEKVTAETELCPSLDHVLLGHILGQLGKVGSNLNQIAKWMNTGQQVGADKVLLTCKHVIFLKNKILESIRCLDDNQG